MFAIIILQTITLCELSYDVCSGYEKYELWQMDRIFCMHIALSFTRNYTNTIYLIAWKVHCQFAYEIIGFDLQNHKHQHFISANKVSSNFSQTITPHLNRSPIGNFHKLINKILTILTFEISVRLYHYLTKKMTVKKRRFEDKIDVHYTVAWLSTISWQY